MNSPGFWKGSMGFTALSVRKTVALTPGVGRTASARRSSRNSDRTFSTPPWTMVLIPGFSPRATTITHPIGAFEHGTYRLYGLRFSSDLFIAGNGGIKLTRSIAEDLHLLQCLEDIKEVRDRILIRLQEEYSQNDLPVRYGRRYLPPKLRSY
jgi:hypothetical protein